MSNTPIRGDIALAEADADRARLVLELAERLGTAPLLRRLFRGAVARARRSLAGGRP